MTKDERALPQEATSGPDFKELVGPELARALEGRGFASLTPVQAAVLDPALQGRDLRISSQTGSGKTVAVGFVIREAARGPAAGVNGVARPRALVIAPTRELAKQVEEELSWLFAPFGTRVASVTGGGGGGGYRDERRAFAAGPAVIVGTPGRLLDHLRRGGIDPSALVAIVLDEADRMLDLGFREDLEAILATAPTPHATHLLSATFPRDVRALADRVQNDPVTVEGTPHGIANVDIDHIVHLVSPRERVAAIVNLLLADPGAKTLIFARTRAEVNDLHDELRGAGFRVRALSGEMEQPERNRALADFKRGILDALVATDVAARGIDVQDISRVIHTESPNDVDTYTHRSGRTGRAGRKGVSSVFSSPGALAKTSMLLRRAGVRFRMEPIPSASEIRVAREERLFAALTGESPEEEQEEIDERYVSLARRLVDGGAALQALTRLLARPSSAASPSGPCEPREVTRHAATGARPDDVRGRREPPPRGRDRDFSPRERPERAPPMRDARDRRDGPEPGDVRERERSVPGPRTATRDGDWVPFRVTWGSLQGADPRRIVAMMCRRGRVRGESIGAIRVAPAYSIINITAQAADDFERAALEPDARDPRVTVRRDTGDAPPVAAARERESESPPPPSPLPAQPPPPLASAAHSAADAAGASGAHPAPSASPRSAARFTRPDRLSRGPERPSRGPDRGPERPSRGHDPDRGPRAPERPSPRPPFSKDRPRVSDAKERPRPSEPKARPRVVDVKDRPARDPAKPPILVRKRAPPRRG